MIQYKLKGISEISPWSSGENSILHWFALTDSYYWFDFKGVKFPKYSNEIIEAWSLKNDCNLVDYYFARLFWDVCDVLRYVEISVPDEVIQQVNSTEKLEKFIDSLKYWTEFTWDESEQQYDDVYEVASGWLYNRRLDFGYLTGGPDLFLLRNKDQLLIYWFAEARDDHGISVWEKPKGLFTCNYSEFIEGSLMSFKAFGLDMRKQITTILNNPIPNISIDSDQIYKNQIEYEELVLAIEHKNLLYADEPEWSNTLNKLIEITNMN